MYYLTLHEFSHDAATQNKIVLENQNICARPTQTENRTTGWKIHTVGIVQFAFLSINSPVNELMSKACSYILSQHIDQVTNVVLSMCYEYGSCTKLSSYLILFDFVDVVPPASCVAATQSGS
jgi:hypothetical protein